MNFNISQMSANDLIKHYEFDRMPVEGTLYKNVYKSDTIDANGRPAATSMIGMYSHKLKSVSCFHKLKSDEIWHFYGGDPIILYMLLDGGEYETITLGSDIKNGQLMQYIVPAGVWQAGELASNGDFALFSCTMAPGFYGPDFEAAIGSELEKDYPKLKDVIRRLSVNGHERKMPEGYEQ